VSLLVGFLFGFIGSIPVAGPIALLVFAYGVSDRFKSGLYVALGGALAESAYAYMAYWGLHRLIDRYPALVPQSRGVGAVVIFAVGLAFVLRKPKEGEATERRAGRGGSFALGFTITALNPTFIVTWTAAATTLFSTGLVTPEALGDALPFAVGAFAGIVSWFTVLLLILRRFKGRFSAATLDRVVRGVGVALIGLSLWFAWSFVRYLLARGA
jgi:threonine/homoserine/homoserine lactone efflux protein